MIPSDYRLEHVAVGLIERLEGARRSFAGDPDRARAEMARVARAHVAAAVGEYREVALERAPSAHAAFLEAEVLGTFLPRYERLALAMTVREESGYGLGKLAEPAGRLATAAVALVLLAFLLRFETLPIVWPITALVVATVFVPDALRMLTRRRYRAELQELVADMARIQEQATAYLPAEQLRVDDGGGRAPRRSPEREPGET